MITWLLTCKKSPDMSLEPDFVMNVGSLWESYERRWLSVGRGMLFLTLNRLLNTLKSELAKVLSVMNVKCMAIGRHNRVAVRYVEAVWRKYWPVKTAIWGLRLLFILKVKEHEICQFVSWKSRKSRKFLYFLNRLDSAAGNPISDFFFAKI